MPKLPDTQGPVSMTATSYMIEDMMGQMSSPVERGPIMAIKIHQDPPEGRPPCLAGEFYISVTTTGEKDGHDAGRYALRAAFASHKHRRDE